VQVSHDPRFVAPPPEVLLVDTLAVAGMLSVSRRHVEDMNREGLMPAAIRIGRAVRWSVLELRDWCNAGCPNRSIWESRKREVPQCHEDTKIVDRLRSVILYRSLEFKSEGVEGNSVRFPQDKQQRAAGLHIHIGNFQGILGNVSQSPVPQQFEMKASRNDFKSLRSLLRTIGIPDAEIETLRAAFDADERPKEKTHFGKRVSQWVGGIVVKIADGAYKLAIEAALERIIKCIWQFYGF
jgi:predicted DNA-binding transcriptional regulator AlpA